MIPLRGNHGNHPHGCQPDNRLDHSIKPNPVARQLPLSDYNNADFVIGKHRESLSRMRVKLGNGPNNPRFQPRLGKLAQGLTESPYFFNVCLCRIIFIALEPCTVEDL